MIPALFLFPRATPRRRLNSYPLFCGKLFLFFLCLSLGFPACKTESNKKAAGTAEDIQFYQEEIFIPLWDEEEAESMVPAGDEAPSLHVTLSLVGVSAEPGGKEESLDALLRDIFYRGMDLQDYAEEQIRLKTREYRDIRKEIRNQPDRILSGTLNWYYDEDFRVEMNSPRFLVISRSWADYTGGAHGNYGKNYFVFNRETARRVLLSDIIGEEFRQDLAEKINGELRKSRELGGDDSLRQSGFFVNQAEPTENFFLSPEGIGFHWDPYEIGPYSMGFVEVVVPYGEIGGILKPLGRSAAREAGSE
ncbi:MAG: DUF3298 and DUF4163 domain-containing protein [Treponema sp.]|nr:DUF3298 and DUF4163 domain-containing protein [Treponema sp.]